MNSARFCRVLARIKRLVVFLRQVISFSEIKVIYRLCSLVSRWSNKCNYPNLALLFIISAFHVYKETFGDIFFPLILELNQMFCLYCK